jgi:hypothetical protein
VPKLIRYCLVCIGLALFFLSACQSNKPDTASIDVQLRFDRFEQDLFRADTLNYDDYVHKLEDKYQDFLPLYLREIIGIIDANDSTISKDTLLRFLQHPDVLGLFDTVQLKYADLAWLHQDLTDAFKYARYYFRDLPSPRVITYIGGPPFCFNIDTEFLAIGLDGYLGSSFSFYRYFPDYFPQYKIRKFDKPYIVPNAINVWLTGNFEYTKKGGNLLDVMVYNGKVLYATKKLLPDTPDSLIFGYSEKTLTWLELNEAEIWKYFIKNKLLYENDPLVFSKYVNEAPTTSGMPEEAPGNIGSWLGYRIVERYGAKKDKVTLLDLMNNNDAQQVLTDSKYKP